MVYFLRQSLLGYFLLAALIITGQVSANGLPPPIQDNLQKYKLPGHGLSIYIAKLNKQNTDAPLISFNADVPRNPASTIKVLTTFAGLAILGPEFTWQTEVHINGARQGDRVRGDVIIKGNGDPFLTTADAWRIVQALYNRGLRHIDGNLLIDDSYFAQQIIDPGAFDGKPNAPYNAPPNAMLMNFQAIEFLFRADNGRVTISATPSPTTLIIDNQLRLSRGRCRTQRISLSVSANSQQTTVSFTGRYPLACGESSMYRTVVPAPQLAAGTFRQLWQAQGGTIGANKLSGAVKPDSQAIYVQASRPLAELVRGMNKYSNNVMTRQLFLTIGAQQLGAPATLSKSRQTITLWLAEQGLQFAELVLDNGAGLSRDTRITARHLGQLLALAYHSDVAPELLSSLPIIGIDGTMRRRFRKDDLLGKARLKTGTLNDVRALAGYLTSRQGDTYVLVMLHNQTNVHHGSGSRIQDAVLRWLYEQ